MYAIISPLDADSADTVQNLWHLLREKCGLAAIYKFPTPHMSWFGSDDLDINRASPVLSQIAESSEPLNIHIFGVGIFTGKKPILYLPLVKSIPMITLHQKIWDQVQPYSEAAKQYYSPSLWVPHTTLALNDLTHENLCCAIDAIAFDPIELFVRVNSLIIAESDGENPGQLLDRFEFKG